MLSKDAGHICTSWFELVLCCLIRVAQCCLQTRPPNSAQVNVTVASHRCYLVLLSMDTSTGVVSRGWGCGISSKTVTKAFGPGKVTEPGHLDSFFEFPLCRLGSPSADGVGYPWVDVRRGQAWLGRQAISTAGKGKGSLQWGGSCEPATIKWNRYQIQC